jgi:DNA polymerase
MDYCVDIPDTGCFDAWRQAARNALSHHIPPEAIEWSKKPSLFAGCALPETALTGNHAIPRRFLDLAGTVVWHNDPERYGLLYMALWRISHGDRQPMSAADTLGARLEHMARNVRRDLHKMHAFVRFRELPGDGGRRRFAAWFEPDHNIIEPGSAFFAARFADMDWLIAAPQCSARFEDGTVSFSAGVSKPDIPPDASEALWETYFTNIFNPARTNVRAMLSEMPKKYWRNLPETRLIPDMLANAGQRVNKMHHTQSSAVPPAAARISQRYRDSWPRVPHEFNSMADLALAATACQRCGLCEHATQTVCGEGNAEATLMIVGEQPGDREDLEGRPFAGPAGQVLRRSLSQAGIPADRVWLTNAVKHFKFRPRGKHRLHQTPAVHEIEQCRWWLMQEIALVRPRFILALGATAAFALTGTRLPVQERRQRPETGPFDIPVGFSWHPAFILRLPDPAQQRRAEQELIADLTLASSVAGLHQDHPKGSVVETKV